MSISPLAQIDALRIGSVDFVSPDELKVLLDIEAPGAVALNNGSPRPFPRINGYVLVPNDDGYLVGQVEWVTVERSQYPKRKGMQDFGLVDLPFPLRKMSVSPVGTLVNQSGGTQESQNNFRFRRGVESFPSVGDNVILPTNQQLRSIIESGTNRRVNIGTSPLADNAKIAIDPDRLFGRHVAILGNTGSGKSCSTAGLIRWSLEEARKELPEEHHPNARFIVLDPNGEYSTAFNDLNNVRRFAVEASSEIEQLQVPHWFWNSAEWCAFTQASGKTQRPTLIQALRHVKDGSLAEPDNPSQSMRRYLRTLVATLRLEKSSGSPWGKFLQPKAFFEKLGVWLPGLGNNDTFSADEQAALFRFSNQITLLRTNRSGQYPAYDFTRDEVDHLIQLASNAHSAFGGSDSDAAPIDADTPRPFAKDELIKGIEATAESLNVSDYIETMLMRVKSLLSDVKLTDVFGDGSLGLDNGLMITLVTTVNRMAALLLWIFP